MLMKNIYVHDFLIYDTTCEPSEKRENFFTASDGLQEGKFSLI